MLLKGVCQEIHAARTKGWPYYKELCSTLKFWKKTSL